MNLTREEFELLLHHRAEFLIRAYHSHNPHCSLRACARDLGLSPSTCYRILKKLKAETEAQKPSLKPKPKPRSKASSRAKAQAPSLSAQMKAIFDKHYHELTQQEYYWTAKEMTALKAIGQKLTKGMQDKGISPSPEELCKNFRLLLSIIEDDWILKNLSPAIINSKYNDIRTQYARRQQGAGKKRTSFDDFRKLVTESL